MGIRSLSTASISTGTKRSKVWDQSAVVPTGAYESIATVTLTGTSSNITFSSIPSTYKHLQIRYIAQSTRDTYSADNVLMKLNGNFTTSYSRHNIGGYGTGTTASGTANSPTYLWQGQITSTVTPNIMGLGIIDILDYADTSKSTVTRSFYGVDLNGVNNTVGGSTGYWSGAWFPTDAVSSIQFTCQSADYAAKTQFALYGIKG